MADKPIKANLKIQLFANDVVVAESADEVLWRRVLTAMQSGSGDRESLADGDGDEFESDDTHRRRGGGQGVAGLAKTIGATKDEVIGACEPSKQAPYLHLDAKCWEAFKRNTPVRGRGSVGPTSLVGTLLCLWYKFGGIEGKPTQAQTLEVLNNLGVVDKNPSRTIKNCAWLQSRPDGIQINPAEMTKAESIARAFIKKSKVEGE